MPVLHHQQEIFRILYFWVNKIKSSNVIRSYDPTKPMASRLHLSASGDLMLMWSDGIIYRLGAAVVVIVIMHCNGIKQICENQH